MTRMAVALFTVFIVLSMCTNKSYAQNIVAGVSDDKFTVTVEDIAGKEYIKTVNVIPKAITNFSKLAKTVTDVTWYKVKDGYMVYFRENGAKKVCGYNLQGKWMYNLVSYTEEKLPRHIFYLVRSVYYNYSIIWVNEVQTADQTIHVIHMEGKDTSKNIKVCNGEMQVIGETVKTKS